MRGLLLPIVAQLALACAGLGILRAARVLGPVSLRSVLSAGGLAYLVGVAVVMQSCVLLLVLGLPFGLPMVFALCVVFALPLALDHSVPVWREWRGNLAWPRAMETRIALLTLGVFAAFAIVGLVTVGNSPLTATDYDAWNLWGRKAVLMLFGSHLPLAVLSSPASGYIHPDYPLVLSLLEATHLRALGRYELSSVNTVIWSLAIAFVWAGAYLSSRVARPSVWGLLFPGVITLLAPEILTGYADAPMAFYLGLGVLCLGFWLQSADRRDLLLSMLLLAGACGIKNEGLMGTAAALVAGVVVLAAARRTRRLRELLLAACGLAVFAVAPWRVWLAAHRLRGDLPLTKGLDPSFLIHRFSRVSPAVHALYGQLENTGTVAVAVPVALAIVLLMLWTSRRSLALAFYPLAGLLYFAALVWAIWISPLAIDFAIQTSVVRIYLGVAFIALAAIVHLGGGAMPSMRAVSPVEAEPASEPYASASAVPGG